MRRTLGVVTAALTLLVLFHATTANAEDRPYTVTVEGVQLTDGTFQANGHINWRTTHGTGSIHFDPLNGQPGGTYIGASFFPIPLAPGECLLWVQVHPFNYHFGEQNEAPICTTPPTSPTPSPSAEPSSTPSPEPSSSEHPTPTPTPTNTPQPSSEPTPIPSMPISPTGAPVPTPSTTPTPSTGIGTPEFPPTSTPTPTPQAPTPTGTAPTTPPREDLAVTGPSNDSLLFGIALALLLTVAGGCIYITREKK